MRHRALLLLLAALSLTPACEVIDTVRGFAAAAGALSEHLETDVKAELTDDKITKVITVTPALTEFSKTAKHKWDPHPESPDFTKLASALGGLADYTAFFEGQGTRLTEYYVDLIKIVDARGLVTLRKATAEARAKQQTERGELEAKLAAAAEAEKAAIQTALDNNARASELLEQQEAQALEARKQRTASSGSYSMSDAEIARVEARLGEIEPVMKAAGYGGKE